VLAATAGLRQLVLVGGAVPVSFFAYQGVPGRLLPDDCIVSRLTSPEEDSLDALEWLAARLKAGRTKPQLFERKPIPLPTGALHTRGAIQAIAATIPKGAIICTDSGIGNAAYPHCQNTAPHSWLSLTGGAIGQGGPVATGAALACPRQRAPALLGDGGAAYTNQCLWTQSREDLNVTTVIFANRRYGILETEYARLGITDPGKIATSLFDIGGPEIDWVAMATSFGVPGAKARTAEELAALLQYSFNDPGPFLIEACGEL